jgi:hypothetical protein
VQHLGAERRPPVAQARRVKRRVQGARAGSDQTRDLEPLLGDHREHARFERALGDRSRQNQSRGHDPRMVRQDHAPGKRQRLLRLVSVLCVGS